MHALRSQGWLKIVGLVASAVVVVGCAGPAVHKAPVEDRGTSRSQPTTATPEAVPAKPLPGAENAGKPGYYTVKPGDTLIRIGLDNGQSWKDIARWNMLDNPNVIEVGQVLRVISPNAVATENGVTTRPVASSTVTPVAVPAPVASATTSPASAASAAPKPVTVAPATQATAAEDDVAFIWPTSGGLIAGFDEAKNKGLDLGGKSGDAVLAAADGRVVYAGAGLRGYGNLLILKHNNTYLTAYAHNQTLLVKEDQSVRKGQKIAEMGSSDTDRVKLHFEIRRQGKPVDPAKYLPNR
nr:peptidoglycan DD-metalloendopeptidase family protein [uncultured Albidiferax sp.]